MIKLTNSKQWKEELVINFKDQLSEASAIKTKVSPPLNVINDRLFFPLL